MSGTPDVVLVVGLFPWPDQRVATPMQHTARVCGNRPGTTVFYIDAEWPATPGRRWRHAVGWRTPPHVWRIVPVGDRPGDGGAAVRFRDVVGVSVAPTEMLSAMDRGRVVLWCNSFWPEQCHALDMMLAPDAMVYDCHETVGELTGPHHGALVERADVLVAVSQEVSRVLGPHPRSITLGNGIEADLFMAASKRRPRWTFGFVGNFLPWIDAEAIYALARKFPEESIVLVGPVDDEAAEAYQDLVSLPNVTGLPPIPYESVPQMLQEIEVCLLPRRPTPRSLACDPLKLYEYLAAGRPVAATAHPSVEELGDVVYVSASGDGFAEAAGAALDDARSGRFSQAREDLGQRRVRERTWRGRVERVLAALDVAR